MTLLFTITVHVGVVAEGVETVDLAVVVGSHVDWFELPVMWLKLRLRVGKWYSQKAHARSMGMTVDRMEQAVFE